MTHNISHSSHAAEFACPMHPEVKGREGDKCPKCGMSLEKVTAGGKVSMAFRSEPERVEAGKPAALAFTPKDESDSARVVELEETHEKRIHVIAVSEDLSWFDHIHAEPSTGGSYKVLETFPAGGAYVLYADYKPLGGGHQTDKFEVNVTGVKGKSVHHHEPKATSSADGYTLTVMGADKLETGSVAIPLTAEKDGIKLKRSDFENYLGAVAHIILVSQDEKDFVHIHPESTEEYPIYAHADIPKPGIYRMWVQFQTNGTVHTADFTLSISEGSGRVVDDHKHSHAGHNH